MNSKITRKQNQNGTKELNVLKRIGRYTDKQNHLLFISSINYVIFNAFSVVKRFAKKLDSNKLTRKYELRHILYTTYTINGNYNVIIHFRSMF